MEYLSFKYSEGNHEVYSNLEIINSSTNNAISISFDDESVEYFVFDLRGILKGTGILKTQNDVIEVIREIRFNVIKDWRIFKKV